MPSRHPCPQCDKFFSSVSNVSLHVTRAHNTEEVGRFVCDLCLKPCQSRISLQLHKIVHQTAKPFACEECDRKFKTENSREKHHKSMHLGDKSVRSYKRAVPGVVFKCDVCDREYHSRGAVVLHKKNKHTAFGLDDFVSAGDAKPTEVVYQVEQRATVDIPVVRQLEQKSEVAKVSTSDVEEAGRKSEPSLEGDEENIVVVDVASEQEVGDPSKAETSDKEETLTTCFANSTTCPHCPYTVRKPSQLKAHMVTHTGERPFHCRLCLKSFTTSHKLHDHCQFLHASKPIESTFQCTQCSRSYRRAGALAKHRELKHSVDEVLFEDSIPGGRVALPFQCELCIRSYLKMEGLNAHLRVTHNVYKSKSTLHMEDSTRKFACTHCPFRFAQKGVLDRHILTQHSDKEKRFHCGECPMSFYQGHKLKLHATSSGHQHVHKLAEERPKEDRRVWDEPQVCGINECRKEFSTKQSFETHQNYFHSKHKCDVCAKEYGMKHHLQNHVRVKHMNESAYVCEICSHVAFTKNNLAVHRRTHSDEKLFNCVDCEFASKSELNFRSHITHYHSLTKQCPRCGAHCATGLYRTHFLHEHLKTHVKWVKCGIDRCRSIIVRQNRRAHAKAKHGMTFATNGAVAKHVYQCSVPMPC